MGNVAISDTKIISDTLLKMVKKSLNSSRLSEDGFDIDKPQETFNPGAQMGPKIENYVNGSP